MAEPGRIVEFPRDQFPTTIEPEVGMQAEYDQRQRRCFPVVVTEVKRDMIVLDANHPLAGKI